MLLTLITQQPQALVSILKNTPVWVGGLFAALVVLGLSQARSRRIALPRLLGMPLAMSGLSLWGTISAFKASPHLSWVLLLWLGAALSMLVFMGTRGVPAGVRFDAASRRFHVPGSWLPLALIIGIFLLRYGVGVELALQPASANDMAFALTTASLYGSFTGAFAGHAWRRLKAITSNPQQM